MGVALLALSLAAAVGCTQKSQVNGGDLGDGAPPASPATTVASPAEVSAASGSAVNGLADGGQGSRASGAASSDAAAAPREPAPGCTKPVGSQPLAFRGHIARPEGSRAYEVRLPAAADPQHPARVVFILHPFGSTALDYLNATHFPEIFNPAGWAVVAPDGVNRSFNAGDCCGQASREKVDDVGFLLAIIDDLKERACIQPERVYLAGFSNGGFLSQAFACAHPERVGAIQSVGGMVGVHPCEPKEPVSALIVNGIGDDVIPVDGGGPYHTHSLGETLDTWRDAGGCEDLPGDGGVSRSVVGVVCRTQSCREGRTLESCLAPYAHVWMVKSHPAGDVGSARQTAREVKEFFELHGIKP